MLFALINEHGYRIERTLRNGTYIAYVATAINSILIAIVNPSPSNSLNEAMKCSKSKARASMSITRDIKYVKDLSRPFSVVHE
jgi:hypothetical protein